MGEGSADMRRLGAFKLGWQVKLLPLFKAIRDSYPIYEVLVLPVFALFLGQLIYAADFVKGRPIEEVESEQEALADAAPAPIKDESSVSICSGELSIDPFDPTEQAKEEKAQFQTEVH